ncbi:MAG: hypothetical protein SF053_06125 [Bacteroidia bacterium]|nr:hypothetical protein [Bacteroidia bacterium]
MEIYRHVIKWLVMNVLVLSCVAQARAQETDCRILPEDMHPLIQRYNPFVAEHQWIEETRMELVRLNGDRFLIITQDGCKRHHIRFNLMLQAPAIVETDSFWVKETCAMMRQVYWGQAAYEEFRREFERAFTENMIRNGLNRQFNFPVGGMNFLCEVRHEPAQGAQILVEMVTYVFREKVEGKP